MPSASSPAAHANLRRIGLAPFVALLFATRIPALTLREGVHVPDLIESATT